MRVAIYARMSTLAQEDSTEVQLEMCQRHAEKENLTVVAEYVDPGKSGSMALDSRPNASRMLQDARLGLFDAVLAQRLDRLGRDDLDLLVFRREAQKRKLQMLFCTQSFADDPAGDFAFSIMSAVGQLERRLIGQRTYEHSMWLAKQGRKPCGSAPIGLTYDPKTKQITPNARADDAIAVFQSFVDCGGSPTRTASLLNAAGIRTNRGNLWSDRGVKLTINNTLYRQVLKYDGMEFPAPDIPIIIPLELVKQAQSLALIVKGARPRQGSLSAYSSILVCGLCGHRLIGSMAAVTKYRSAPTRRYRCPHGSLRRGCPSRTFGEARLDRIVVPILRGLLQGHIEELAAPGPKPKPRAQRNTDDARNRLIDLHVSGLISKAELQVRLDSLAVTTPNVVIATPDVVTTEETRTYIEALESKWGSLPATERRNLLLAIAPRIEVAWVELDFRITLHSPLTDGPIECKIRTERARMREPNN